MGITKEQFIAIMPTAAKRAAKWLLALNAAMDEFEINTPLRQAAFLSQIAHESGELRYVKELGADSYFDKYDSGRIAERLGNTPEVDGDGARYKGRGPIQTTGRTNYLLAGMRLDLDLLNHPELLEIPEHGARASAFFWWNAGLNEIADTGDIVRITRKVNGGLNGLESRRKYFDKAKQVLL